MKLDVSSLYRIYEKNYHEINQQIAEPTIAFKVLNDALIYSCLQTAFKEVDIGFSYDKFSSNTQKYEREMGTPIFFLKYKKKIVDDYTLLKIVNSFNMILGVEKSFTINAVEEVLGNVLEQHINRKATGSYYTPVDTTTYITKNTILMALINNLPKAIANKLSKNSKEILEQQTVVINRIKELSREEKNSIIETLDKLKIIDPTCGSGAFIITAYNFINDIRQILGEKVCEENTVTKTMNMLYGLDNSNEAIVLTKMRLILKVLANGFMIKDFDKIFEKHFIVADAFAGKDYFINTSLNERGDFDWKNFQCKFDAIIGNPPYVETANKILVNNNFATKKCGNLYATTIERACNIANENAVISFIVPLSFIATPRMNIARELLQDKSTEVFYASFADRPGCVFKGVHQRLVIFTANTNKELEKQIYTSKYHFWYNKEREELYNNITYIENNDYTTCKIGSLMDKNILFKIEQNEKKLTDMLGDGDYSVYMSSRIGFWTKCFIDKPSSSEFKEIKCKSKNEQFIINAFFNSSTFYYYWVVKSDCWHVSEKDYKEIGFDIGLLKSEDIQKIVDLSEMLLKDLEKNKKYIGSKQVDYEYKHKYSKYIIDQIDDMFAHVFGFSKEEIEYIKNYTIEYRMNDAKKD